MRALLTALATVPALLGCPADENAGGSMADDGTSTAQASTDGASSTGAGQTETDAGLSGSASTSGDSVDASDSESDAGSTSDGYTCVDEFPAVVTDIDGTLTIADAEFLMQVDDGNYDPQERFGSHQMLGAYADLGYKILYLTGRPEIWTVEVTNETAREVTERWLDEHDFPDDPEFTELVLAPELLSGEAAQAFKAQAILDLQAKGWRFDYAYGNSVAEIGGYDDAGIAKDATFIIGNDTGMGGTTVVDGPDWSAHANAHIPTVPAVCGAQ